MFNPVVQYIFITIVFIIAVGYVIKMLRGSFGNDKPCAKKCCGKDSKTDNFPTK